MADTSTPRGAQAHARAQAASQAARVRFRPTIPVTGARDLPDDVDPARLVWDETLGAGGYATRVLERGSRVRLIDVEGDACAQILLFNADQPQERLCVADTIKVQWQAYLGEGSLLLSDMGRVLASIVRDESGQHDPFCGPSTARSNAEKYGSGGAESPHPSARDRFLVALAKHGLTRRDLGPSLSFFKGVRVARDGAVTLAETRGRPGQCLELRAEMRVLLVVANAPHVLDPRPRYEASALRILARSGPVTGADDALRGSTPERLRAFENVEDYYRS